MSADFAALVGSIAVGVPGVRSCLLVTSDGLPLAATPPEDEERVLDIWAHVADLGDVERGFLVTGRETWVFCQAESYGGLAVTDTNVRPGIVLDRLQQLVAVAEDYRARREVLTGQGGGLAALGQETARAGAPRRFRLPLHRDETAEATISLGEPVPVPVAAPTGNAPEPNAPEPNAPEPATAEPAGAAAEPESPATPAARQRAAGARKPRWAEQPTGSEASDAGTSEPAPEPVAPARPPHGEVDVAALSREFSGLLVEGEGAG